MSTLTEETYDVIVVDGHRIWREGVRGLLEHTEFNVVGEASTLDEARIALGTLKPRVLIVDIRQDGWDGLNKIQLVKDRYPEMSVLLLRTFDDPGYMARAASCGVSAFVFKWKIAEKLLTAVRALVTGESTLTSPELQRALMDVGDAAGGDRPAKPLMKREARVLQLLTVGKTNCEIGSEMSISQDAVEIHVNHIIWKLGVSDRAQAAVWAVRHGYAYLDNPGEDNKAFG